MRGRGAVSTYMAGVVRPPSPSTTRARPWQPRVTLGACSGGSYARGGLPTCIPSLLPVGGAAIFKLGGWSSKGAPVCPAAGASRHAAGSRAAARSSGRPEDPCRALQRCQSVTAVGLGLLQVQPSLHVPTWRTWVGTQQPGASSPNAHLHTAVLAHARWGPGPFRCTVAGLRHPPSPAGKARPGQRF